MLVAYSGGGVYDDHDDDLLRGSPGSRDYTPPTNIPPAPGFSCCAIRSSGNFTKPPPPTFADDYRRNSTFISCVIPQGARMTTYSGQPPPSPGTTPWPAPAHPQNEPELPTALMLMSSPATPEYQPSSSTNSPSPSSRPSVSATQMAKVTPSCPTPPTRSPSPTPRVAGEEETVTWR
ncbi:hypothetical protein IMZ48_15555 [Candidatus Bathyarchaeota archaeon]|nr:hypothetical protein [Candidatus Bathyarchaeota archaeon]